MNIRDRALQSIADKEAKACQKAINEFNEAFSASLRPTNLIYAGRINTSRVSNREYWTCTVDGMAFRVFRGYYESSAMEFQVCLSRTREPSRKERRQRGHEQITEYVWEYVTDLTDLGRLLRQYKMKK